MNIAVASGKGGTGKTTVATNLALSVPNSVYLDCDVEEPDGHLFLNPLITKREEVYRLLPQIDHEKCNFCGECARICQFNALTVLAEEVLLFEEMCHSCGVCSYICPMNAIKEVQRQIGAIQMGIVSPENAGFVRGCLNIGEMMPGPLIEKVKSKIQTGKVNILDAPPGTACPMVEAVKGTDYCVLVTEPTPFGLNDLQLAVQVMRILSQPFGVVLNKYQANSVIIEEYCRYENIPVLLKIPFDRQLAEAYSRGEPAVRKFPEMKLIFKNLIREIKNNLQGLEKTGNIALNINSKV
jgi:MinD superfamily P-loop ATPase